jgi:hypothetical protein
MALHYNFKKEYIKNITVHAHALAGKWLGALHYGQLRNG